MKVAINGAGVAGPSLAYWLLQGGHDVLLVEESTEIRTGGYVIDFCHSFELLFNLSTSTPLFKDISTL